MATKKRYLPTECRRAIRKMMAYALANPMQVNQNRFPNGYSVDDVCSSAFCSAGHAVIANQPLLFTRLVNKGAGNVDWEPRAAKALNLPKNAETGTLFSTLGAWPQKFQKAAYRANNLRTTRGFQNALARVFAARWQEIIDTDGAEINPETAEAYRQKVGIC